MQLQLTCNLPCRQVLVFSLKGKAPESWVLWEEKQHHCCVNSNYTKALLYECHLVHIEPGIPEETVYL